MKVPVSWLREFIDLPDMGADDLATTLAMIGHEVEGHETLEAGWTGIVVGEVLGIAPHPDADRIRVCSVDTGRGPEQIICGAWNFDAGARVAVARPGAVLPGGMEIDRRTIRGVDSNGMICSERELGLGDDHTGILVLDGDPEIGIDFTELVELPDLVFDLKITPNRPDALSLIGLARDLGAYLGLDHRVPELTLTTVPAEPSIEVEIGDPVGCRRFTAREIRGVTVGPSPFRVRQRLVKAGMRPISNVVDATNYVMIELGHPLHAFDADSIVGNRLVVRRSAGGETLVTLDGEERALSAEDLIIYDDAGPTSMSGTMGGARSEVSAGTTNVLMEAASWDPPTIMYMSRRHGLRSEASTRFERGVDPDLTTTAERRAAAMVAANAGGEVIDHEVDVIATEIPPVGLTLDIDEVTRILGPGFDYQEVADTLTRLGMTVGGTGPLHVVVPTFRPDVTRPADLIEEVARIHGFDRFESTLPTGPAGGLSPEQRRKRRLLQEMTGIGITEAVTLPFVGESEAALFGVEAAELLRVQNPLRDEEGRLRPLLLPGLLDAARYNLAHGSGSAALFETGLVFHPGPSQEDQRLPTQVERLAWVIVGPVGPQFLGLEPQLADGAVALAVMRHVAGALGIAEVGTVAGARPGFHPGRTAEISLGGATIGHVGELAPSVVDWYQLEGRVAVGEVDLRPLLESIEPHQALSPSVFPHVDFDLSFLLPEGIPAGSLVSATREAGGALVEAARVFDEFRGPGVGEGERAIAVRYRLRATDHTLTNEEVAPVREAMISAGEGLGARLRGA